MVLIREIYISVEIMDEIRYIIHQLNQKYCPNEVCPIKFSSRRAMIFSSLQRPPEGYHGAPEEYWRTPDIWAALQETQSINFHTPDISRV